MPRDQPAPRGAASQARARSRCLPRVNLTEYFLRTSLPSALRLSMSFFWRALHRRPRCCAGGSRLARRASLRECPACSNQGHSSGAHEQLHVLGLLSGSGGAGGARAALVRATRRDRGARQRHRHRAGEARPVRPCPCANAMLSLLPLPRAHPDVLAGPRGAARMSSTSASRRELACGVRGQQTHLASARPRAPSLLAS